MKKRLVLEICDTLDEYADRLYNDHLWDKYHDVARLSERFWSWWEAKQTKPGGPQDGSPTGVPSDST